MHGEFIQYFANQLRCSCQFENGAPIGKATFTMGSSSIEEKKYPDDEKAIQEISDKLFAAE